MQRSAMDSPTDPALTVEPAAPPPPSLGRAELTREQLTGVVAAALRRPVRLLDWSVTPVGAPTTAISTEAVLKVHGRAHDGTTTLPWAVLVKILRSARHWPFIEMVPAEVRADFIDGFRWRVEADALGSDLPGRLPAGMRTPRVYRIDEPGDDRVALWVEYIEIADVDWNRDRYAGAARLLGQWAGRCAAVPDARSTGSGLHGMAAGPLARRVFPQLRDDAVWAHPLIAAGADPALRADLLALVERVPAMLDRLDALPAATGHGDACPQNLLVPRAAPDTFVAIDISWQQPEALGFDLGQLLIGRAHSGALAPADLSGLHEELLAGYLRGLHDEGCDARAADVRYGFDAAMVIRSGFTALPLDELHRPPTPELRAEVARRLALTRYLTDIGTAL